MSTQRIDVLGVKFDSTSLEKAVQQGLALVEQHNAAYVVTPNPEIVLEAEHNKDLQYALGAASLVLPDGIGVIYSAKILGTPLEGRVTGIDFATRMLEELAKRNGSVFLLGAKPGVAEKAGENMKEMFPGLRVVGTHDGYFKEEDPVIEEINAVKPDFLFVCLGFPKQEIFMHENTSRLDVGIMAGLGGCLDVFSGEVERAPDAFQKAGLEWLYRLYKEPSRFRRMAKLPKVLFKSAGRRLRGSKDE